MAMENEVFTYTGYDYLLFDILSEQMQPPRDYSTYRCKLISQPIDRKNYWLIDGAAAFICGTEEFTLLRVIYGLNGYLVRSPFDICQALKIDNAEYYYRRGVILGKLRSKSALFQAIKDGPSALIRYRVNTKREIHVASRLRYALEHEIEPDYLLFSTEPREDNLDADEQVMIAMLTTIEQLRLSVRSTNILKSHDINTLYELMAYNEKTKVSTFEGLGKKSYDEIDEAIAKYGFAL